MIRETNLLKKEKSNFIDKRIEYEKEKTNLIDKINKLNHSNIVKKDNMKKLDKIAFGEHYSAI